MIILAFSALLFSLLLFLPSFSAAGDFTAATLGDHGNVSVIEVTGSYDAKNPDGTINSLPRQTITKEFFRTHKDEYDFVVIFSNFDFQMPAAEAKAFYLHVKNDVQGIGNPISDNSSLFGSNGKLQGIIDMGNLATLTVDPTDPKFENTLSILAHELMHRWGAYVKFKDSHGNISTSLLGKDHAHWSYLLNSYGSVLYGNQWQDNDDGTFTSIATQKYYSPIDLYLMGVYDKSQVPPMLLIENPNIEPARMPETGATITGTPLYISIDDIILAEGERIPKHSDAQKNFKTAFIFITAPGTFTGDELYGIENIRNGWVTRFSVLTDGKGITQVLSSLRDDIPVNPGIPLPPFTQRTLPPSIEDGVTWLMDNQKTDGSWIDLIQTTERDTSETVFALKNFTVAGQQYSTGLLWLGSDESENTDYLSRKTETLAHSGQDASAFINQIVLRQNPDGGWGCNKTYMSNPMDTSLALKALTIAGYSNQTVVSKAIEYLKVKQNMDGGWGGDDGGGAIETTTNALTSFSKYRTNYQLEDQITKGIAWLTQRQNTDGGFGNSPSTVSDSSLAVMALREFNVSSQITNNGLNYLLDQQSENGSWHESPYQTALAISAVWKATIDPDLSVKSEDITFIPAVIKSLPTTAVINVTMWNAGRTDVSQVKVALYDGAVDETKKIGEQTLAFPGQSSVTVTFPVTIPDGNEHRFYVSVDPDNRIEESNETNNIALNILKPEATYDLEILSSDITVSQNPVDIFQDVKLTSKITNRGTMNAYNVQVRYYIDEPDSPFDIATSTLDVPANSAIVNEITWRTNKSGENLPVTVHVDPFNTFAEMSEENNIGAATLTVNGATDPNLVISYKDITLTPHPANENGSVHISALIRNEGFSPATDTVVKFFKGVPGADGVLLGSQTIPIIIPGESSQTELDWPNIAESGERIISIKVDPDNLIGEIREDDNDAFTILKILGLPDLNISANSIVFTPPAPKEGDIVSVHVTVKNSGEQAASDVSVRAYEGGVIAGSQIIPTIPGNSQASAAFTYDTSGKSGARNITLIVDPENVIIERSEDNNSASRSFGVQDANLWLTEQYISPNGDGAKDSTQFFFRLGTQLTVKIAVVNNKGQTVRTFNGSEFENSSGGNITWDGLDDNGMVVDDGQYQIKIVDGNNRALGSLLVVVDNNRSPLTDAIGTKYLLNNNLTCKLPSIAEDNWHWFPDESGILFEIKALFQNTSGYANGLYVMSPNGEDILRIVPSEWNYGIDPIYDYSFVDYDFSKNGEKVAFILHKYNKSTRRSEVSQLWIVDSNGLNLKLIDSYDLTQNDYARIEYLRISPDGVYVTYIAGNPEELWIIKSDGTGKTKIDPDAGNINFSYVRWSPDSQDIAYIIDTDEGWWKDVPEIRLSDISGNNKAIFFMTGYGETYYFEWLNDTTILASMPDKNNGWKEALWLIDKGEEGNHKKITGSLGEFRVGPDNKDIAFIEYVEDAMCVKISDDTGNSTLLYTKTNSVPMIIWGSSADLRNLIWSPDGRKTAFVDDTYGQIDACPSRNPLIKNYIPYLIVVDSANNSQNAFKVGEAACITYDCVYSYPECYASGAERFGTMLSYLQDNIGILVEGSAYFIINSETGERSQYLPIQGGNVNLSPHGRYITYDQYIEDSSTCFKNDYSGKDTWVLSSLLNLTADFISVKEQSSVILKGSAADFNFEEYALEYADTNNPDIWNLVSPPSDISVINDVFTAWIPPYEGTFYVRLTVQDKAGNVVMKRKRIHWGFSSSITNLYKSREIFSPNNDGVNDTVGLHYKVLEPVHLEFTVSDANNNVISTIHRDYAAPADDFITWDGRDSSGKLVSDGQYRIKVFDYEFFFEVDNTPPDVDIEISPLIETNEVKGDGYFTGIIFYKVTLSGLAYDKNLKNWTIEYSKNDNSQEWFKVYEGGEILAEKDEEGDPVFNPLKSDIIDFYVFTQVIPNNGGGSSFILNSIEDLVGNKYRITAEDYVGNKRTKIGNMLEEKVKLIYAGCNEDNLFVLETVETETKSLTLQYKYGQSNTWRDWANIPYPSLKETEQPVFKDIPQEASLRIKIVDVSDNEYYSDEMYRGCSDGDDPPPDNSKDIDFTLHIYNADANCGLLSDGKTVLSTRFTGLGQVSLLTQSYYIQKPEGLKLLRQFDLTEDGWGSVTIDTLNMSEGSYPVKVVLTYLDFDSNSIKEISAADTLIVDRVLPTAQITYPGASLMLCPVTVPDSNGNWFGIPVEGIVFDNANVKRYELYYGIGDNPGSWVPAMTRVNGKVIPISANGPKQGQLGVWDVTSLKGADYSLKLKVVDAAGNAGCTATSFSVDALTEIGELTSDKSVFSPNGDEFLDDVKVNYQIDEFAIVDVKAFKLIQEASGTYIFDSSPVRTLSSGLNHLGGEENVTWDGKDDSGTTVPDGLYGIAVYATDSCANANMRWVKVEVDNSPPSSVITYPRPPDPLGNVVEIKGTADDLHFQSYILEAGEGDNPETWLLIKSNTSPVKDNILGIWNTFGLHGTWILRLIASDTAGNKNETTVVMDLAVRKDLIKDLGATPMLFSPNNDGRLDTVTINYELTDACQVKMDILDSIGGIKKTYTTTTPSAGTYSFIWDGRDILDAIVIDGTYTAKLSAALSSNPSVIHEEAVTIIVDSTLPMIDIKEPLNNSFLKGDIVINGTIADNNIFEYSITYSGDTGSVPVDKANQNRENYTFGVLNAIPEGSYNLNIKAKDIGENTTETNIGFIIDRTPPKVTLDNPNEGEYYGSGKKVVTIIGSITESNPDVFSLRYGSGDNPAQWTDLLNGNTIPINPQLFLWGAGKNDGIPDGIYTLSLYAKDKAGLTGEARVTITIDNTLPEVAITSPQNGGYVRAAIDIKGTASDTNLEKYTLELSEGQCSSAFKWAVMKTGTISVKDGVISLWELLPSDGDYCMRLTAVDKPGNSAETKGNLKVDTHPPSVPVLSGAIENRSNANLSWTVNGDPDIAGYDLYRNGLKVNTAQIRTAAYQDQNMQEGVYAYTVKAVDFAGNESNFSNEIKIRIDITGPDAKVRSPLNGASVNGIADIKGTAYSSDDFKQYRIYIGQGPNPTAWNLIRTSPVPVSYGTLTQWDTLGLNGFYSIKLEAEDIAGNITTHQITVTVDDTPPAPPVLISAIPNSSDVVLTWQANTEPDLAGYLLYRNNQLANVSGIVIGDLKPHLITGRTYLDKALPDGKFTYYLIAMDQAGNQSGQSNTIEVNIDTHPPHATIIAPADQSSFDSTLRIMAESTDTDIAFVQFQYKRSQDSAWINLDNPLIQTPYITTLEPSARGLTYGAYHLRAVATDRGGKADTAPPSIAVTYTDITAPSAPYALHALTNGKEVTLTWTANAEADLNGYNIYRTSGTSTKINSAVIKNATYQDSNLTDGVYAYEVTAVDTLANESGPSNSASAKVYMPILVQPYTPTGEKIIPINGGNADAGSSAGMYIETLASSELQRTVSADATGNFAGNITLTPGENRIMAKAQDSEGNISRMSDSIVVVYNEPPLPPTGFTKSQQDYDVTLTWNQNIESDLSGYNLFRNDEKLNMPLAIEAGVITAASYDYYNLPESAFDSDTSTYWMSDYSYDTFSPVWWEIDLPSPELISHFEIRWFNDWDDNLYLGKDYEIQVWSGYAWITQTKVTGNAEADNVIELQPSYRTDKIRIYITDVTNTDYYKQVGISEISILKDNLISEPSYLDANLHDGKYQYKVTAVDYYGFESLPSEETDATVGDVTSPAAPQNLTAASAGSDVILKWSSNAESDLSGYNVCRNSSQGWLKINISLIATNTYTDGNLLNGIYTYRVTAVDAIGNESLPSNEGIAQIAITLLQPPINLHICSAPEGKALNIFWEYSGGLLSGYNLYRSTTSGGPYVKLNASLMTSTSYLDKEVTNGATYYYVVTAVDAIGNESAYSDEAMGIPSDTVVPHQSLIFFPTIPGNPILLYNEETDISGIADPASVVELFQDGDSAGKTTSLNEDTASNFPVGPSVYNTALSPDGKTLAYAYKSSVWLRNLATGDTTMLIQKGTSPCWAPDGRKLAYIFYDASNYSRIGIYDMDTGAGNPLTDDTNVSENYPSWSSDGTMVAFRSNKGGSWNAWIKDIESGSPIQITNGVSLSVMKLSPDGEKLAYFKSSELYVADLTNNTTDQIDSRTDGYSIDWSPESNKLAFISRKTGNSNIFVLDMNTRDQLQITNSTDYKFTPIWSPDGNTLAFGSVGSSGYSVWIKAAQATETERVLIQNLSYVDYLSWVKSGGLAFLEPTLFHIAYIQGYFNFKDIQLDPGENLFYVVSADESGNASSASDEISVIFDTHLLPDIEVTDDDISIYPPYPLTGQTVTVTAVIRNAGMSEVKDVAADIYLWDSQGDITLIKSANLSSLSTGAEIPVSFVINATLNKGSNKIIVVTDPQDKSPEIIETNNLAIKEFFVAETEGVTLATTLNHYEYRSNQDINILIDLKNSGCEKDGAVETWVEDEDGRRVAAIDTRTVQLPYAAEHNYSLSWNTGSVYAGAYSVHVVFKDGANIIAVGTVPFAILPDINIDSSVVTNKFAYDPNEDVTMSIDIKNNGNNYVFPELGVTVNVMDASKNILFTTTMNIINLLPGTSNSINSNWNTRMTPAGNYSVVTEIFRVNELVLNRAASFSIKALPVITGNMTVSPAVVMAGNAAGIEYAVRNTGNAAVNGLGLNLLIIDPETQEIMSAHEDMADLGINSTKSGGFTFSTQGYGLKTYTALLQAVYQGNTKTLATASFTVKDVTPPVVTVISPVAGSYNSTVYFTASAVDDASGVDRVEFRLDTGEWRPLPVSGQSSGKYATTWTPLKADEGTHSVSYRSVDKAGNMSVPVFADFTFDLTPPPPPVISSPPDNSFVQSRTVDIRGVAEPGSTVTMAFAGNVTATADAVTGEFIFEGITLNTGINLLTFTAEDSTGNRSDRTSHTLRFDISEWLTGTLSVQPNPANQGSEIRFIYTIANSGDEDVPSVFINISLRNPVTQELLKTFESIGRISKQSTLSGNVTDSLNITPGIYEAVLSASNDQMAQPKTLGIENFEIKASLEAEKKLTDAVNLLVWINEDCHERKGMHTRCKDDHERCRWVDSAEELLRVTVDRYSIVYDKKNFQEELRNPLYTDIFIMGNHHPLEDGYDDELREQVYSGKGLISSLFLKDGENRRGGDDDRPIFGVRYKGNLHGDDHDVDLVDSPVSAVGIVKTQGEALRVETAEGAAVAGWIKSEKGRDWKCKAESYPAIVLNEYGAGKTVYYAFDIGATLDSESHDRLSELLKNSIHYVHTVRLADSFAPYQGIPVEINLNSPGSIFDLRITETYPLDVKIYDLSANRWITENPWIMTTRLEPDEAKSIQYLALPPDMSGTYPLETNIEYMENGSYIPYRNLKADFVIDRDAASIISDILASLKGLQTDGRQRAKINEAIRHVEYIQKRTVASARDIEKNISDIMKAIDSLISLDGIDVSAIRLQMANLLRIWEGRYYLDAVQ